VPKFDTEMKNDSEEPGGSVITDVAATLAHNLFGIMTPDSTPDMAAEAVTSYASHIPKIFLQKSVAQGIAGAFAFAAMLMTCWQVL